MLKFIVALSVSFLVATHARARLPDEQTAILHSAPTQPFQPMNMGLTYHVSNEPFVHSYADILEMVRLLNADQKVGYIGLGAEQNYTLAALLEADVAWLVDRDENILLGHKVARAAFLTADTALGFLDFYDASQAQRAQKFIYNLYGEVEGQKIFNYWQSESDKYRFAYQRLYHGKPATNFLSNPNLYQHARKLFLEDRIVIAATNIVTGNYFEHIANVANQLNVKIGALYLSNSLDYLLDSDISVLVSTSANIMHLPFARQAQALVTTHYLHDDRFFENSSVWQISREDHSVMSWVYAHIRPKELAAIVHQRAAQFNFCSRALESR